MQRKSLLFILFSGLVQSVFGQWNSNSTINNGIAVAANDQQDLKMASDSKGGAIIAWADFRADNNNALADIYVQHINKEGVVKWTVNGKSICTQAADQTAPVIIEDGNGGAILAWQDFRNGTRDIYAQKVDSNGTIQWTANGVSVASKTYDQRGPRLAEDGSGGAIIVWEDSVNGNWDIYAQHINASGVLQWNTAGVAVCTSANSQINPRISTDGAGGAYITWQDKRNGNDYDIYLQHLTSLGTATLTANGLALCTSSNTQSNPKIQPDNAGGVYVVWQDKRTGSDYDVYGQHINASGTIVWTSGGKVVCNSAGSQSAIDITTEGISDGIIICWKDSRNTITNVYAQKVSGAGTMVWSTNGILISALGRQQLNPGIVGDANGGAIVVYQDSVGSSWDIYAQRVSAGGSLLWGANGVAVGNETSNQISPKNISDGNGGAIFAFQDKRSGDNDLYAFKIEGNGFPAGIKVANPEEKLKIYPNPFHSSITLVSAESIDNLDITDISGKIVYSQSVNSRSVELAPEVLPGIYLISLTDKQGTKRIYRIVKN